ncbi:MAG: kinase/pyrophosphorylase, partial [Gammaproteobacteria bacterium]
MASRTRTVFFLSDHTGISVETLANALLAPFPKVDFLRHSLPFIDTIAKAEEARELIRSSHEQTGLAPIVFSTLMDPVIRAITRQTDALCFDFLETFTAPLEKSLGVKSEHEDISVHGLGRNSVYDDRIDAINFTLAHDDGVDAKRLEEADIIVIGVSRAAKTPTCVYLAVQYGLRAANFPITEDDLEQKSLP